MKRIFKDKDLVFDEEKHEYKYRGVPMLSVTQYLSSFFKEFDKENKSKKIAEEQGKTQEEVLKEWEDAKDYASDFGTKIHRYAELVFKGMPPDETSDERELAFRKTVDKFKEDHPNLRFVLSELPLCIPSYKLAGTVDLVLTDGDGKFFLYDWKTSKRIDEFSRFNERLLSPFEYLDDCNFVKYSLQLNLYNLMLNRKGLYPNGLYIVHLREDGYKEYKVPFMRDEVSVLLSKRIK